jgi:hypothetical protein
MQAKKFWSEFVKNTDGQKRIVFVESVVHSLKETEEENIQKSGGPGFITFLAAQANIEIYCPEPNRTYEMNKLAENFSKENIAYFYFARSVNGWHRIVDPKPEFDGYIVKYLERDKNMSGWIDFDFSIPNIKKIHKEIFGTEFDQNDSSFFKSIVTPVNKKTISNQIAQSCSDLRNEYIIKEICKYWGMKYSVYIHYGAGHAVMQEPVVRSLIG